MNIGLVTSNQRQLKDALCLATSCIMAVNWDIIINIKMIKACAELYVAMFQYA